MVEHKLKCQQKHEMSSCKSSENIPRKGWPDRCRYVLNNRFSSVTLNEITMNAREFEIEQDNQTKD